MRGVQLQGFTHAGKICECSVELERNSVARIHTRGRSVNAVLSMRGIQLQGFTHAGKAVLSLRGIQLQGFTHGEDL